VAPSQVTGATDARHYAGLSDNIYRFAPFVVRPEDLKRIHGTDERISVEHYAQCVRFYHQLIINSAQ
jgi:carboxypeptidase PM20D1